MSVNIDALFQHLMKDPDIIPPEGEDKEDIAMAMATQRAKQSNNNLKALNMATADRSVSKLLYFLKAEDDEDDSPLTPAQMNAYAKHLDTINKLTEKLQGGGKLTAKQQRDWDAAEKFSEDIATPADLPGIHDVINEHEEAMVDVVGEGAGEQPGEEDDDTATPAETPAETPTKAPQREGEFEREARLEAEERVARLERRAAMSPEERKEELARRVEEEEAKAGAEAMKDLKAHHSLTSAVDALSDAAPNVELDHYGNDADSPFHQSRFGDDPKAYHNIHAKYSKEVLEEAFDHHAKPKNEGGAGQSPHSINFGGRKDGSIVESEVHSMMDNFFESQGKQEVPSDAPSTPEAEEGADRPGIAREMTPEAKEAARKVRTKIEDTPASNWFEANVPDKGADATAWDSKKLSIME